MNPSNVLIAGGKRSGTFDCIFLFYDHILVFFHFYGVQPCWFLPENPVKDLSSATT